MRNRTSLALLLAVGAVCFCGQKLAAQIDYAQEVNSQAQQAVKRSNQVRSVDGRMVAVPAGISDLKLAPGYLVKLAVVDDSDFEGEFRVDAAGAITIPNLGTIPVAGQTVIEARQTIRKILLDKKILKDPQVLLSISEYTVSEVTLEGEITTPGRYPILTPLKLVDLLAQAGGMTILASDDVEILREGRSEQVETVRYSKTGPYAKGGDTQVRPGDVVRVKRAGVIYVLGAVSRPGGYVMQEGGRFNLLEALSVANGTTNVAGVGKVYVLRHDANGAEQRIEYPLSRIVKGKEPNPQLQASDVVYVPTNKFKAIYVNSQALAGSMAAASVYRF